MKCFKCHKDYPEKVLIVHLKIHHSLNKFDEYQCIEKHCDQFFSNVDTFKKHIKKHKSGNDIETAYIAPIINPPNSDLLSNENGNIHDNFDLGIASNVEPNSEIQNNCFSNSLSFSLNLHSINNFNRKNISLIQKSICDNITRPVSKKLSEIVASQELSDETNLYLNTLTDYLENPFFFCDSEYKFFKCLKTQNLVSDLFHFKISDEIDIVQSNGEAFYDEVHTKGVLLPVKFQMKSILEKTGLPDVILNNNYTFNDNTMSNFINSSLWKNKIEKFPGKICAPFFLYFDGFEVNNPLGSHSESITGIYFSFPFLDMPTFSNVFVLGFIKSKYFSIYGNDFCLKFLVQELKSLEEDGLIVKLPSGEIIQIFLILGLIVGDNLGVNGICDFSKSFSANHYCRFCMCHKSQCQSLSELPLNCIRDEINYNNNLENKSFKESGIAQNSIFNTISSFHVTNNFFVDVMHDIYEGICHYDLCHILNYFIKNAKFFSLQKLNQRKQNFNYGLDVGDLSPEILESDIKKFKFKMSASEMKCFIHYLPLMIGDLVSMNDKVWHFLINLVQLVDILLLPSFNQNTLLTLSNIISNHLNSYVKLFKDTLKPKHHLLLHYVTCIENSGPPKYYWCFGFEHQNKITKDYAKATNSRIDICLSMAKKSQLKFAHYLQDHSKEKFITNDSYSINSSHLADLCQKLNVSSENIYCFSRIEYKGKQYKESQYLMIKKKNLELFQISEFFYIKCEKRMIVLVNQIFVDNFNYHYQAYEIKNPKNFIQKNLFLDFIEFNDTPVNLTNFQGLFFIRVKH